jgi:hypothetical protein
MTMSGAFEPDLTMWHAWVPTEVASLLAGVQVPWYVAAGWAIELFLGGQRREHGDLEIAVPRKQFGEIASRLAAFDLFVPIGEPDKWGLWPIAEVSDPAHEYHQTWVREPDTGYWRLDIFREPSEGDTWIFRRDERIRRPYQEVIAHTADGIPYARPEVTLLFKAKWSDLPKNQADFADTLPHLEPESRRWLRESLALVHPGHPWLASLG